ncbi:UNVERIFIED_CONTAM: hypothetical protein HDU68_006030, partial [Siphonaria sp. JEL0065]
MDTGQPHTTRTIPDHDTVLKSIQDADPSDRPALFEKWEAIIAGSCMQLARCPKCKCAQPSLRSCGVGGNILAPGVRRLQVQCTACNTKSRLEPCLEQSKSQPALTARATLQEAYQALSPMPKNAGGAAASVPARSGSQQTLQAMWSGSSKSTKRPREHSPPS